VEVQIDYVDWEQSYICGCLNILGLTEQDPSITTFFTGEIIGKSFPFLTRKWDATYETDKSHWRYYLFQISITIIILVSVNSKILKNIKKYSIIQISTFPTSTILPLFT